MHSTKLLRTGLLLPGLVALLAIGLTACSEQPISPISDFDYRFPELEEIGTEIEIDTTTIEVEFTPAEEDTVYLEEQDDFVEAAREAVVTAEVAAIIDQVADETDAALDEDAEHVLDIADNEAQADPDAYWDETIQALADSSSEQARFVAKILDAAATQEALSKLLGLKNRSETAIFRLNNTSPTLSEAGVRSQAAAASSSRMLTCREDAQAQYEQTVAGLQSQRDSRLLIIEATYSRDLEQLDAFVRDALEDLTEYQARREREAIEFYQELRGIINALEDDETIPESRAQELRRTNMLVFLARMASLHNYVQSEILAINLYESQFRFAAEVRRDSQREYVGQTYATDLDLAKQALTQALSRCHNQGGSNAG